MPSTRNSKYSAGLPLGFRPDAPRSPAPPPGPPVRRAIDAQMAVKRVRPLAVLDDDQVAVAGELARQTPPCLRGRPGPAAPRRQRSRCRCWTMAVPNRLLGWRPNRRLTVPRAGQGSVALERPQRQHAPPPGVELRDRRLQALLRGLELARRLRVQVAARVDRRRRARCGAAPPGRAQRARGVASCLERVDLLGAGPGAPCARAASASSVRWCRCTRSRSRRVIADGGAIGAAERPQVVDVEQQPPVAGAAQLVELHEPGLDVGALGVGDLRSASARARVVRRRELLLLSGASPRSGELLDLDLALELQLAQLDRAASLSCAASASASRCSARIRSRRALGGAFGALAIRGLRESRRRGQARRRDQRHAMRRPGSASHELRRRSEDRLAIDVAGNLDAEVLQHGRRDVHDRRRRATRAARSRSSTPAVVAKS